MERVLIMMVGVPGSGKSTVARNLRKYFGFPVVSSDDIREQLYGNAEIQGNPAEVFAEVYRRGRYFLDQVNYCILDATNCSRSSCDKVVKNLRPNRVIYIIMDVDIETCLERNAARDRVVPEKVIYKMQSQFDTTVESIDNGQNDVFWYREDNDYLFGYIERIIS